MHLQYFRRTDRGDTQRLMYATAGSAAADVRADVDVALNIKPNQRVLVPTGLFLLIPTGYEVQLRARSGLAINHGITLVNGLGTIDSDYTGELKVPLINLGDEEFTILDGMRIAQIVLAPYVRAIIEEVKEPTDIRRVQRGGFGSTGVL